MKDETEFSISQNNLKLLRLGWPAVVIYLIVFIVPYMYLDMYRYDNDVLYGLVSFALLCADYLLVVALMRSGGLLPTSRPARFGTFFFLFLSTGVLIFLGMIVFFVPGYYLLVRWLAALPRAVATDDGIGEAMSWSWGKTRTFQRPLLIAAVGPFLCFIPVIAIYLHWEHIYYVEAETASLLYEWTATFALNGFQAISSVWLTILGVSAYQWVLSDRDNNVDKLSLGSSTA